MTLSRQVLDKRVLACVGSGGVGKTTCSAALGVRAAVEGKKALVLTIDPARRLANSLGLSSLGNVETRISDEQFRRAGLTPKGALWAMTLDLKLTWDELVTRYAPSEKRREQILGNRLYRQLSTALAGSLEYMAMEKVYGLSQSRDYDLIVLDTPPTTHALDFLDAPNRLLDVLDNDAAKWLLTPALAAGEVGLKLVNLGGSYVAQTLAKFTGVDLLRELAQFLVAFGGMYDGFKERAARVKELLASEGAGFVLVTSPGPLPVDEAIFFAQALREARIPVQAAVVNRVYAERAPASVAELGAALAAENVPDEGGSLATRVGRTLANYAELARADRVQIARLAAALGPGTPLHQVPRLAKDVHDIAGLWTVDRHLFDGGA